MLYKHIKLYSILGNNTYILLQLQKLLSLVSLGSKVSKYQRKVEVSDKLKSSEICEVIHVTLRNENRIRTKYNSVNLYRYYDSPHQQLRRTHRHLIPLQCSGELIDEFI